MNSSLLIPHNLLKQVNNARILLAVYPVEERQSHLTVSLELLGSSLDFSDPQGTLEVSEQFIRLTGDKAVRDFQTKVRLTTDGIVGRRTWEMLMDKEAVREVETGGRGGFLGVGKPAILFEGHIFWSQLKKKGMSPEDYLSGNEDLLYPKWTKAHYKGGKGEYGRLQRAMEIDPEAAMNSASWGLFTSFIKGNSLGRYLREKDWAGFARRYNEKLKAAYEKHKATNPEKVL